MNKQGANAHRIRVWGIVLALIASLFAVTATASSVSANGRGQGGEGKCYEQVTEYKYVKYTRERVRESKHVEWGPWSEWTVWGNGSTVQWSSQNVDVLEEGDHDGQNDNHSTYDRDYQYKNTGETRTVNGNEIPCPSHKVWICHVPPGNPANAQAIEVDENGWNGHDGHEGDFLIDGPNDPDCPPPPPPVDCPDGTQVPAGQECPPVNCPDGTTVPNGDECPPVQCPDGSTVPNGDECPMPPAWSDDCVNDEWVVTGPVLIDGPEDQVTLQAGESHTMVGDFADIYWPTYAPEDRIGSISRPEGCEPPPFEPAPEATFASFCTEVLLINDGNVDLEFNLSQGSKGGSVTVPAGESVTHPVDWSLGDLDIDVSYDGEVVLDGTAKQPEPCIPTEPTTPTVPPTDPTTPPTQPTTPTTPTVPPTDPTTPPTQPVLPNTDGSGDGTPVAPFVLLIVGLIAAGTLFIVRRRTVSAS